jgi:hypothetical protein
MLNCPKVAFVWLGSIAQPSKRVSFDSKVHSEQLGRPIVSTPQAVSVFAPMHEFAHFVPSHAALAFGCEQLRQLAPHCVTLDPLTHALLHRLLPTAHWQVEPMHAVPAPAQAAPDGQHAPPKLPHATQVFEPPHTVEAGHAASTVFGGTLAQVPSPFKLHLEQVPQDADAQQTPSVHLPLAHAAELEHALP